MKVGILTAKRDHPVVAAVAKLLVAARHEAVVADPERGEALPGCAVYLLKARTPRSVAYAAELERGGARVVNAASATAAVQDRTRMAELAARAGLPFAPTRTAGALSELLAEPFRHPLVVKSRHSRSGDLVTRADSRAELAALAEQWPYEPVVVQPYTENSGWDHKLWAVGDRLFAGLRRSELAPGGRGPTRGLDPARLPPGWAELVHRTGRVFGLGIYGVDILQGPDGPVIVDVNAFPGIREQPGAPEAIAALALAAAARP